ncbi:hypothetical protein ACFY7H_05165 [Streptomyces sp. NPDC012794]|uniref:hypothetical protein n=1 Tax=Streptomyces sp. NPDC012794 TaxID=3364850 RepID=UPI0036B2CE54
MNSGDLEVISKTIDEVVEPDVLFHAPIPTAVMGAQALKHVCFSQMRQPGMLPGAGQGGGAD